MNYVLKGSITRAVSGGVALGLDETLTIRGMAADAKAAGDAIRAKADAADVTREIERVEREMQTLIEQGPGENNIIIQEAKETAEAAKTIAESTQDYVASLVFVKTVNGVGPDEFGNVNVEINETVLKETIMESTEVTDYLVEEVLAAMPVTSMLDFSNLETGSFTEVVDGETVLHAVTYDADGRPTKIDNIMIAWGD
jgi:hypothetical protein